MATRDPIPFDLEILLKYDKPGPRYTSYPTAPVWDDHFGPEEYRAHLIQSNLPAPGKEAPAPLSLYVHIPFCFSLCYYCGCNVVITRDRSKAGVYLDSLEREVDLVARLIRPDREVVQLHWGGGSPDFLRPPEMQRLFEILCSRFRFHPEAEIGVELDPRETTREHLEVLRDLGFNRISLGIQDFDPEIQRLVNRIQPEEMTRRMIQWCRELGFHSINVDLIYGLPGQTVDSFARTVDKVIDINPDRIAVFNYAHVPWLKKHQRLFQEEMIPRGKAKLEILQMVIERFTRAGYVYIGMDHFARPHDELYLAQKERTLHRNFQGYTTKAGCDLLAFGITAISMVRGCYAQNHKALREYYHTLDQGELPTTRGITLSRDDEIRRHVIMEIMCHFVVYKEEVANHFGIDFDAYFDLELEHLKPLEADGLCEVHPDRVQVTPLGRLLVRNVAMVFDRYLREANRELRFSRTV